jgi:hypothetical protein
MMDPQLSRATYHQIIKLKYIEDDIMNTEFLVGEWDY